MTEHDISKLIEEASVIEKDLKNCESNFENIGGLAIRVQSFSRTVHGLNHETSETRYLYKQADAFNKRLVKLGSLRTKQKDEANEELMHANIKPEKQYMESSEGLAQEMVSDSDFFSSSTKRINDVLMNAMDAFETVKRQNVYINRTNDRIKTGLSRLGLSKQMIDEIDRRYLSDKFLFMGGIVLCVILFFLLRMFL
ncbi:hypothetical protein CWI42_081590 [Ordospora colligata]|uniref:Uncharacterized protein n=1 Tax=Ordospora colligata OC4 TaxID=1354746 RepID=A0A0B2UJK7_9MICR|nr:uncharacterized protein M896_081590 [Ordospora colligata OC4]KHN69419.1 hypothetical protein M896_081590 [Ordospora colligata OC4]TBU14933.1 hypothetical protein CWI41_081580 [Ordospora colligata]TBU15064.1 hypothetical protein CWI40_081600 [Ordospora colligata]TBU18318.1 hypothetical protein CWI42_081590 [Ordospora colligata]